MEKDSKNPTIASTHDDVSRERSTSGTAGSGNPAGISPISTNGWRALKSSSPIETFATSATTVASTTTTALRAVPRPLASQLFLPLRFCDTPPWVETRTKTGGGSAKSSARTFNCCSKYTMIMLPNPSSKSLTLVCSRFSTTPERACVNSRPIPRPLSPNRSFSWPVAMVIADADTNPASTGGLTRSNTAPNFSMPTAICTKPDSSASVAAFTGSPWPDSAHVSKKLAPRPHAHTS